MAIIGHGRSSVKAVKNAIRAAKVSVERDVVGDLRRELAPIDPDRRQPAESREAPAPREATAG